MESFSTEALVCRGRAQAWNEIYSTRLSATDFIPQHGNFSAGLKLGGLGQISLARLVTGPCTIRRTDDHISGSTPRVYSFLIQLAGRGLFHQGLNEAMLRAGDFTMCDNAVPHFFNLDDDAEMLLVRVPGDVINDYLPHPELLCGRRLPAREGLTPTAALMACGLWKQLERGFRSAHDDSIAHQLLDMISTSYSVAFGSELNGPDLDAVYQERVLNFIEDHIRDPGLNAQLVAGAIGIDAGELAAMFSRRGDSLRAYILRRRLELAARQLRNPRWRGSTVAQIAYGLGFTSLPLFTRAYRRRFGVSPGDYRKAQFN
ncbi:helix-turn-helix domain-containing protein [Sphingobium lignivorans]|uniref:AraC-like DNA-binding protein n=1 Tax=Sphingobium lignivorans TaxID=2735886 RepID=A0ABR6NCR8_9SPHN|nr:helix-turn-helix domain-containing protein [Sphingobium lignivorans]MBB5984308.1 AraC-like DNA-binding protein [Sphingobium lignivorans]